MGKWNQGEYNRVCNDKFKRLFYASVDKGSVEYDVDVERDWRQFIKDLDPEKKTVQACFTSLVNATKAPICPRHHIRRAGPSVHVPRAFRHYDTSNARTTRGPRPEPVTRYLENRVRNGVRNGVVATGIGLPDPMGPIPETLPRRLRHWQNPAMADTIGLEPDEAYNDERNQFFDDHRRMAAQRRQQQNLPPVEYGWGLGRLPTPPPVLLPNNNDPTEPFSPPRLYDPSANTPTSLSGARGRFVGLRIPTPEPEQDDDPYETQSADGDDIDTTYPLFAPLDDAGPYPNEDIFDNDHEIDEDQDLDVNDAFEYTPSDPFAADLSQGWPNPRPRGALPDTDQAPSLWSGNYGQWAPTDPTSSSPSMVEYTTRARAEVDEQIALDTDTAGPSSAFNRPPPQQIGTQYITEQPHPRRRQREDDDDSEAQWGGGGYEVVQPPFRRPRLEDGAGPMDGAQQRVRRSIPVESLLSATEGGDNRRNGVVFDAESYINPDL